MPASNLEVFIANVFQPILIPCYLFLMTAPSRVSALRNTGQPGRAALFAPKELLKRVMIMLLVLMCMSHLIWQQDESANGLTP